MISLLALHCPHSMRSRVYESVRCPSICPSMGAQQQARYCRFAAVGPTGGRYWSIAARPALSSSSVRRANAGGATLSAYVGSWTQARIQRCITLAVSIAESVQQLSGVCPSVFLSRILFLTLMRLRLISSVPKRPASISALWSKGRYTYS